MTAQLINTKRRARVPVPNTPHSRALSNDPVRDRRRRTNISRLTTSISFLIYLYTYIYIDLSFFRRGSRHAVPVPLSRGGLASCVKPEIFHAANYAPSEPDLLERRTDHKRPSAA